MTVAAADPFGRTCELVDIPSESFSEQAVVDHLEGVLRAVPWLTVDRVGLNLVARTQLGRAQRLLLAGHTDTVPVNGNLPGKVEAGDGGEDVLWGLGASDMKSGLAVMVELACTVAEPTVDLTFVLYEAEEVALEHNGLRKLLAERRDLLACDAAILGEPTGGVVEAGCQGTLRVEVELAGARAHTARPWMGRNAIHRLAPVLERVAAYDGRRPVLDGCEYREALQAVGVSGGVFGNVVPDKAVVQLNHRFAPDRDGDAALAAVRAVVGDAVDESSGDAWRLLDLAEGAPPDLRHPLLGALVERSGQPPRAKLGWTDVAFFAAAGIPATNYGPGDPTLAHTADERVGRQAVEGCFAALLALVTAAD